MKSFILAGVLASCAMAQISDVPPIIEVVRKPGTGTLSSKPYADAKASVEVLGLTAVTGLPETWMIEWHNSFMSVQGLDQAMTPGRGKGGSDAPDGYQDDLLSPARTMIGTLRADWSYHPMDAMRMFSRARYVHISIYRTQPGQEDDLAEVMTLRQATYDSINLPRPDLVYHIISGEPAGVYVVLAPLLSLKILDDGFAALPAYAEPIAAATVKARKKASTFQLALEHFLYRVEPQLSYVSDDFAAGDQAFWRGKQQ